MVVWYLPSYIVFVGYKMPAEFAKVHNPNKKRNSAFFLYAAEPDVKKTSQATDRATREKKIRGQVFNVFYQ